LTIITQYPDGKVLAKGDISATVASAAGPVAITVTIASVRRVEKVIGWNLNLDPQTNATPTGVKITGNVVGATIYVAAGTTISGECLVIGY